MATRSYGWSSIGIFPVKMPKEIGSTNAVRSIAQYVEDKPFTIRSREVL